MRAASRAAHRSGTGLRQTRAQLILTSGERYRVFRRAVDDEAIGCGREPERLTIVGIGKRQSVESIADAVAAGLTDVGENYLQEARTKLSRLPPVRKHFVGHVQTNKAGAIAAAFDVVQSVDRADAAIALARGALAAGKELPVLLQLNISPAERFGCAPAQAEQLAEVLRGQPGLRLEGVMAIGPLTDDRDEILRAFELAAKTLARTGGSTLSIGMSGDWREAVRAGSTMLRVGEALFGSRAAKEVAG